MVYGQEPSGGFAVIDVETTGLGIGCRPVEFAAVLLSADLTVVDAYETLIDPGGPPGPVRIHGISREMAAQAPPFAQIAGDVHRLLRDRVVVAHNLAFDWAVLSRSFEGLGVRPHRSSGVCTAALSRELLEITDHRLGAVCEALEVDYPVRHQAGPDAAATAGVFRRMCERVPRAKRGRACAAFDRYWTLPRSVPPVVRATVGGPGAPLAVAP